MKKYIYNLVASAMVAGAMTSCGDGFLEVDIPNGKDTETAIQSVDNLGAAVNGSYYRFFYYCFAGNYAMSIGDIASDIAYWNGETGHWNGLYTYNIQDTDTYLTYIWSYGYKVVDTATRAIDGANGLADLTAAEQAEVDLYVGEAYALRAYAMLYLTEVFGHQVKVAGQDYSNELGVVVVNEPVAADATVSRNTVGECYTQIQNDLTTALAKFQAAGGDRNDLYYLGEAAVNGLLARVNLYLENWAAAKQYAQKALDIAGITELAYTPEAYKALYLSNSSNRESFFALAINSSQNWSANSCGTLWSSYDYSPSPWLQSITADTDVRRAIWGLSGTPSVPEFNGGKFGVISNGNSATQTNYMINAPEMFLIMAEADTKTSQLTDAAKELLVVAKRNTAITSVADLPSDAAGLMSFIQDERARELFQEGHRLWDLRRWNKSSNFYAYKAPEVAYTFNNFQPGNVVFPIPADEINSKKGVTQNEGWNDTFPR